MNWDVIAAIVVGAIIGYGCAYIRYYRGPDIVICECSSDKKDEPLGMDNWPSDRPHPPPGFTYPNGDVS